MHANTEKHLEDLERAVKTFKLCRQYTPARELVTDLLARIQMHTLFFAEVYGIHATDLAEASVRLNQEMEESNG